VGATLRAKVSVPPRFGAPALAALDVLDPLGELPDEPHAASVLPRMMANEP
jgi:hypothetical protein